MVTAGTAPSNNNPSQDSGSWFVRARAQLVGSPPTEVALEGFAVGLGKALALNSAGIINESSVALVALTSVEGDPKSSVVTLDIDVEDYENGESVMGYFLQLSLSNQQDGGKHIADDINSALSGITTTGCHCAILQSGGFDCTSCVDGEPYSTISNVTIEEVRKSNLVLTAMIQISNLLLFELLTHPPSLSYARDHLNCCPYLITIKKGQMILQLTRFVFQ